MWPSMVIHTRNLCSAFNPSKCTYTRSSGQPMVPGEQLGVRCLAQGSHLSRGIEGGESAGYSLPPPTIAAGPETRTHDLRVTSPTLYPSLWSVFLCLCYVHQENCIYLIINKNSNVVKYYYNLK